MVEIENTVTSKLLITSRVLGYRQAKAVMFGAFQAEILSLANKLRLTPNVRWLLCFEDSYQFAVAFYGVLYAGRVPVLLPNNKQATINELRKSEDGILSDIAEITATRLKKLGEGTIDAMVSMDARQKIIIFTSGSTGRAKQVERTIAELNQEIAALEAAFGHQLGDSVFSTVSHQHIYGLLFYLLWPISAERIINFAKYEYPEQLVKEISKKRNIVVVTSPAFIKRIDFVKLPLNNTAVFSSGGLVSYNDAKNFDETVGVLPIEVLGSTETGGVAYRQQTMENTTWQPFPAVDIRLDEETQCISIKTPFAGDGSRLVMGDKVILNQDGTFQLLGRADRIVKIEGKRISLVQIEQSLMRHKIVVEARVIALVSTREYLAAALVLNEEGMKQLEQSGKLAVNTMLASYLSNEYEQTVLPKRFRYLKQIPYNQQGKIIQADIKSLFEDQTTKVPVIQSKDVLTESTVSYQLFVPGEVEYFKGHFEGMPVLPGVALTDWVIMLAGEHFTIDKKQFSEIARIKFSKVILPNDRVTLVIVFNHHKISFKYLKKDSICSSGVIRMGESI